MNFNMIFYFTIAITHMYNLQSFLPSSPSSDVPFESDGVVVFDVVPSLVGDGANTKCKESLRMLTKLLRVLVGSFACGGGYGNGTG